MTTILDLTVVGTPVPQGSLRAFARRGGGHPIVTADNARTRPWKDAVAWNARRAYFTGSYSATTTAPVAVAVEFRLLRPAGHFGARGNVRPAAPPWPVVKPDLDKLARAVLDALTEAGIWRDDAQVVSLAVSKRYVDDDAPGAWIRVELA